MRPSSVLNALHKHVPLIKFLGPRSKLNKGSINGNPKLHPAAPKGSTLPSQSLTRSDITTNASASNKSKSDSNAQTYYDYSDLPLKYKRKDISPQEIEIIDLGGANIIYRR
nr:13791_t:CDS:2 [Entrophospora candida]CAG8601832.1 3216_t:CDS:2 [Entrophospora candida]